MKINKSFTVLVKLINFLNGKPKFNIDPIHLYTARALKKRYIKNNNIWPIYLHVPLKNSGITYKLNKSLLVRNYSNLPLTTKLKESITSPGISSNTKEMQNFYTWFSGFTDAEGSFYIAISKTCSFRFKINLHKDDLNVLYYIQRSLGFGEVRLYDNYASFTITRLKDIAQLVDIIPVWCAARSAQRAAHTGCTHSKVQNDLITPRHINEI